jgi:hypothetical protein
MKEELRGRGQIVFQIFTTIVEMAVLLTVHDITGRSRVRAIYP